MNDNEVMSIIIKYLIAQAKNKKYIAHLEKILGGREGKKHIEQEKSPAHMSILLFGQNIFIFKMEEYRLMASEIIKEGNNGKKIYQSK